VTPAGAWQARLDDLNYHWGEAYVISRPQPALWLARRRDDQETLRAGTADELHDKIIADYGACPVSRRISRPGFQGGALPARFVTEC
jgi:hypothetical protein